LHIHKSALTSRPAVAIYTLGVVAAFFGGYAYASIPGPNGVIDACYATKSPHTLRVIDSTQTCPSGTTALDWNAQGPPGPGGVNGIQEFTSSGTWVAPSGITHVVVAAWGAGGGGGGGSNVACAMPPGASGGGGGGGGYLQAVVAVTPGQSYNVVVGTPGTGGSAGSAGGTGGNSSFALGGSSLAVADGGKGGSGAGSITGGSGGAGGSTSAIAGIARVGSAGLSGSSTCPAPGGQGGDSFSGTKDWWDASGGAGGASGPDLGSPGARGYVLLTW